MESHTSANDSLVCFIDYELVFFVIESDSKSEIAVELQVGVLLCNEIFCRQVSIADRLPNPERVNNLLEGAEADKISFFLSLVRIH